jgi:hypothetical protein
MNAREDDDKKEVFDGRKSIRQNGCDEKSLREKTLPSNAPEIFGEV